MGGYLAGVAEAIARDKPTDRNRHKSVHQCTHGPGVFSCSKFHL